MVVRAVAPVIPVEQYHATALRNKVTANKATELPGFDEMMREMELHLNFKVVGTVTAVSFVAMAVHYARVVSRQEGSQEGSQEGQPLSTFFEMGDGPVWLLCVAALLGFAAVFYYSGSSESVYMAMHLPVLLTVLGTLAWAWMWRDAPAQPVVWEPINGSANSIVWGVVMSLILVFGVTEYVRGNMRLDGLHMFSGGMVAILAVAAVLAVCCNRVFELFVLTLRHNGFTDDSYEFAGVYVAGVVGMVMAAVVVTEALDRALTFFSGNWGTTYGPAPGLGANVTISQTMRALRLGILAVVGISAALTWRRESVLQPVSHVSGDYLASEWKRMALSMLAIPLIGGVVVAGNQALLYSVPVYRMVWGALATFVVLAVTMGIVPWTNTTIAVAGVIIAMGGLEFALNYTHRRPALLALVLGALFALVRAAYRQWTIDDTDPDSRSVKWVALILPLAVGAKMFARRHDCNEAMPKEILAITHVFAQSMLFYMVLQRFYPDLESNTIEGNETASAAFDALLLAGLLLSTSGASMAFMKCETENEVPTKMKYTGVAPAMASWVISALMVVIFIRVRRQEEIQDALLTMQTRAIANYKKMDNDASL